MRDSCLYRRFMLVAAATAALGALTANVIQETRPDDSLRVQRPVLPPATLIRAHPCSGNRYCASLARAGIA